MSVLTTHPNHPGELTWTLGEILRKVRTDAGIELLEMAAELHVHRNTVSNYEQNRTKPSRSTLIVWADLCRVPVELLLDVAGYLDLAA